MNDRIIHFLALENLTPTRFADLIKVQRSGVSHILSGRNKPSFDFIEKMLLAFPKLSAEWLLLGKGETYKGGAAPTPEASLFDTAAADVVVNTKPVEQPEKPKASAQIPIQAAPQSAKEVENITIFYSDKTFTTYSPHDS